MCIRDRTGTEQLVELADLAGIATGQHQLAGRHHESSAGLWQNSACLLYTSDAADERSSVDLGGRRIIKKKKHKTTR